MDSQKLSFSCTPCEKYSAGCRWKAARRTAISSLPQEEITPCKYEKSRMQDRQHISCQDLHPGFFFSIVNILAGKQSIHD